MNQIHRSNTPFITYRPDEVQNAFSVASLTGVLQKAANRRRFIREEKSTEKMEKFERKSQQDAEKEGSRSESQTSQAPSQLPAPAQSAQVIGKWEKKSCTAMQSAL